MPKPVEIRRLWYRLRLDDHGMHINDKPAIPWEDVCAMGVAPSLRAIAASLFTRGAVIARPVLHVCVRHDEYPRAIRAVVFPVDVYGRGRNVRRKTHGYSGQVSTLLADWSGLVPDIVVTDDLGTWWFARPDSRRQPPKLAPPPPTNHERATKIGNELHDLQDQLRRIEARKKHGHSPALGQTE